MFTQFLEKIQNQYNKELPFVVYRKPHSFSIQAILQKDNVLHYTNSFEEKGFVFSDFSGDKHIILNSDEFLKSTYLPVSKQETKVNYEEDKLIEDKEFHLKLVAKAVQEIKKETFEKVVVSRRIETSCETNPFELYKQLLNKYTTTFCYLWYHPKVGLWMGATPEILLKTDSQRLTTMSLAGTQEYIPNTAPQWGKKELHEQNIVTEYIADNLKGKVEDMKVSSAKSVRAGNLWHLKSTIEGKLKIGIKEVAETLHPTPAVCGLPKEPSKAFVLAHENYSREFYTGYLGELNFGDAKTQSHLFVNLRCVQLLKNKAYVYVGGGITSESEPKRELEETIIKSKTMLNIINFFK